jgi:glycosyltransferase involved in cell wall biosynthesis
VAHLTTVDMSLALLLATELKVDLEAGHTVFGISAPGRYVPTVEELGVTHVPIPALTRSWNLLGDARAFGQLMRTLKRLDLDVLHTHTPKAGVMGRIAGRLAGVPVVVNTCHGLWARPQDSLKKRLFVYGLEALAIRFSDFELFQNAQDARTLRRFLKKDRWQVVGNGVDLERFQFDPQGRRRVRAELHVADDELLVGTIGRRVREKGLAEFAEAAHRLREKATFVWVGPEDDTDAAGHVPHQDAIRFLPERTDMAAVCSALDVFVLASYREGFSRASMEAAACGRPMVLTDIRGCREIGTHEKHLLLAEPHNADALTQQLSRLLDEPDLRARLGRSAAERARAAFDQRGVAAASLQAYATAAGRRRPVGARGERTVVLHVLPHDQNRGAQVYAGQLRDALRNDPTQEHLVVTLFDSPVGAARPDVILGASDSPLRRAVDPRAVLRLRRLIRQRGAAVVVAHGGEALKYVIPAAGRTPTVYYKVGLSSAEIARPSRTRLYGALARRATRVVGVSQAINDQVTALFGVPRERTALIPNGRDPMVFFPGRRSSIDRPLALWIGHLERGKRPEFFLDAVETLRRAGLMFDAAIVGDGPWLEHVRNRAQQLDVSVLGRRTDIPDLLRSADLLVMTSASGTEGMPGVLVEAGLSALPTVATEAAGVGDVIVDGETGYVTRSDDTAMLVDRIEALLRHPPERARLGDAARIRCESFFSMRQVAAQWRRLVDELSWCDSNSSHDSGLS